jgi:hypothetical protein
LLPKLFSNPSRQILNMTIFSQIMDSLVDWALGGAWGGAQNKSYGKLE